MSDKIQVDKNWVEHIGQLAQIEITESENAELQKQFEKVLGLFETLGDVQTKGVEPLVGPSRAFEALYKNLEDKRQDEVVDRGIFKEILAAAPNASKNQFKVQAVIENE